MKNENAKFTNGEWKINHWENNGLTGLTCIKTENGITHYSGDAVEGRYFRIVSEINHNAHNIQGSFEGAHIAEVYDFSEESKANAYLLASAPKMYEACILAKLELESAYKRLGFTNSNVLMSLKNAINSAEGFDF